MSQEEEETSNGPAVMKGVLDELEAQGTHPALVNMCVGGLSICRAADHLDDPLMTEMCSTIMSVLARCIAETHRRRQSGGRWVQTH